MENEEILTPANHLAQQFVQMCINMWADYEDGCVDASLISFMRSSASATRSYLKATDQWIEHQEDKE